MEGIFHELPDRKREILNEILERFKAIRSGDADRKEEESYKSAEWKGHRFIPAFNPETARRYFDEIEIEENTVFLFSYPKTGTNWTAEVIRQILYGHDEKLDALSKNVPASLLMLELGEPSKLDLYEHLTLPRKFFTSHLPAELVNFEKMKKAKANIIIPVRNPKDQAVSWFHFTKHKHFDGIREEIGSLWPQFLQNYVQGKHPTISKPGEWYPEYLLGWYKYKDEDNVMFVHFEDMKKDPQGEIRRMAEFLDIKLTDDRVSAIAHDTSFDSMKKEQEQAQDDMAKTRASLNMLRKGQAGAWKETFTVAQSEMMDKIIAEKMGKTDIIFRYE